MKKLPIGIQNFRKIIEGGYVYADKTEYIYELINSGVCYFLSRPRRFGKSLLLDTIAELFGGDKELFRGLWIYDSDYVFKKHPIIRLDMTLMITKDPSELERSINKRLTEYCEAESLQIEPDAPSERFQAIIRALYAKYDERVVVLVDEYDSPVLDYITQTEMADANRTVIRNFFRILKGMDAFLHFIFFTGVSKFTRTSLFSELNNLNDISLSEDYVNICGFTHKDLTTLFLEHLADLKSMDKFSSLPENGKDCLLDQIHLWYDGYSWDGKTRVFNPFSLLSFFNKKNFLPFWFESGTPSFLIELIKRDPESFQRVDGAVMNAAALDAMDIGSLSAVALMFQTGYLTIQKIEWQIRRLPRYTFVSPNMEVRAAFNQHIVVGLTGISIDSSQSAQESMLDALDTGEPEKLADVLHRLFASIPYELHIDAEAYYHSILYAILGWLGFHIEAEVSTSRGRIDGVLELPPASASDKGKVYVIECKYSRPEAGKDQDILLEEAITRGFTQINDRGYSERYAGLGNEIYKTVIAVTGRDKVKVRHIRA